MKLLDLVSIKSTSVVNNGESLPNVFTDKNVNKNTKKMPKLKKSVYGLGGGLNLSGDTPPDGGDGGGGE